MRRELICRKSGAVKLLGCLCLVILCAGLLAPDANAQIDPVKRSLFQVGYNQPLEGRGPISAYAYYLMNRPAFYRTNITLRLAVAPVFLDGELGFSEALGPNTDVGLGFSGGGFADTHAEVRSGEFLESESFTGHSAEING